ncbi:hypothetical protein SBBP2_2220001 [Burkholderiales bacterium]|nr:hypothetical protein SBBP2_2220001 [Burkholderiales bacterium]
MHPAAVVTLVVYEKIKEARDA